MKSSTDGERRGCMVRLAGPNHAFEKGPIHGPTGYDNRHKSIGQKDLSQEMFGSCGVAKILASCGLVDAFQEGK
jgi:hypothetical protein